MSLRPNGSRDFKLGSCRKHSFFILLWWVCPWIAFVRFLMNCKIIWNVNKLFIKHNDKVFDFDWFFNNFIVHNLLINYLNLSNCSQKQLLASVCVCVHVFPSTIKASLDWNKTINVIPEIRPAIRPAMLCWGNYSVSSTLVATS